MGMNDFLSVHPTKAAQLFKELGMRASESCAGCVLQNISCDYIDSELIGFDYRNFVHIYIYIYLDVPLSHIWIELKSWRLEPYCKM